MPSKIPKPLPVTLFPSLTTLLEAPGASPQPSSYHEGRVVRCRELQQGAYSTDPKVLARRFADFLLSLTGEDEVVFALHHTSDGESFMQELEGASATQHAVHATKQDGPAQECTVTILEAHEEHWTTDFALVLGHAPNGALKVRMPSPSGSQVSSKM